MRIDIFAVGVALLLEVSSSGVVLDFVMMALFAALLAQAWNILGGFGGQFSLGHALFFGTGAYVQAIAQLQGGMNPWLAMPLGALASGGIGLLVGALSFRFGLKGLYFALGTLAMAEVFRIIAVSVPFTGADVGLMVPLREGFANMQFDSQRGYALVVLSIVVLALLVTSWLRHSRFGAYLQAVRDNEESARAAGVNLFRIKLGAIMLSGAFMGAAGAFYVQVFQYIDPGIAYGAHTSVEAVAGAIVGGLGTLWGPIVGALALHVLAELTLNLFGQLPGINLVIYGIVLVLMIMFAPRGLSGAGQSIRSLWKGRAK